MLVLSRRNGERIVFPTLETSIEVVGVRGGTVRLGIEAPPQVPIVREEIAGQTAIAPAASAPDQAGSFRRLRHAVNNRIHALSAGLAQVRRQLQAGLAGDLPQTLDRITREVQDLQRRVEEITDRPRPAATKPPRALLVEDDQNECELLAGLLRLAGYEVATAGDGADALNLLRRQARPDVMLLDMVMPRFDGPATIRAIRQIPDYAPVKIFALTGHSEHEFDLGPDQNRVDRWFRKPVDPEFLLEEMERELRGKKC